MVSSKNKKTGEVFDQYARYYDLLYHEKDYAREAQFVSERLKEQGGTCSELLELGCGTGRHAEVFAQLGHGVTGVDFSEAMVKQANIRSKKLPDVLKDRLQFCPGDVRTVRLDRSFDAAIALFHVMSYQVTNADIRMALDTVRIHLRPGGVFFFDMWHGPAVLTDLPTNRVKRLEDDDLRVTRFAEPDIDFTSNMVTVNYEIIVENKKTAGVTRICEQHKMRYYFIIELEFILESAGFELINTGPWLKTGKPDESDWYIWALAKIR